MVLILHGPLCFLLEGVLRSKIEIVRQVVVVVMKVVMVGRQLVVVCEKGENGMLKN